MKLSISVAIRMRHLLVAGVLGCAVAGGAFASVDAAGSAGAVAPKGVSSQDWTSIRAAYEAGRHAISVDAEGQLVARNPGQQWRARFDGRGFTVTPDAGGWTWGLELRSFGFDDAETGVGVAAIGQHQSSAEVSHQQGELYYDWSPALREWFVNDARGLQQGWTVNQRPAGGKRGGPLRLELAVRGGLVPRVSTDATAVSFEAMSGGNALNYAGLQAWDADGKTLTVRFEQAGIAALRVAVDEREARYPITIDPIAQQAYLKASNTGAGDGFGNVAVSGDTVVVGARREASNAAGVNGNQADNSAPGSGAAYVFVRSGSAWTQQAYLKASNSETNDEFGVSVAVSGDTVVVGAHLEDSDATGVNGSQNNNSEFPGAAYVFVRSGTTWTQQAYLKASNTGVADRFGVSVAVSGDTVVVGAVGEDSSSTGVNGDQSNNGAFSAGAAYVFVRNGTAWSQQAYLKSSNTAFNTAFSELGDEFGGWVAVSGDTVVVGAVREDSNATGVNGNDGDNSLSNSGAAYVFARNGTTWTQQAYLKASNTETGDVFGSSVAVSGDIVVVGAASEDSNAIGVNGDQGDNSSGASGAAYVFVRSGTTWSQQAYLKASNTEGGDLFGVSVAVSGDKVVVGAASESSNATGVNGDQANNDAGASGAAYIFARSGTNWSQQAYLKASNTGASDGFGARVAVSGDTVVVGAAGEDSNATDVDGDQADNSAASAGAAYVFVPEGASFGGILRNVDRFGETSTGLSGATLTLFVGDETFATTTSAADGSYAFAGLQAPGDPYDLRIQLGDVVRVYQSVRPTQLDGLSIALPVELRTRLVTELGKLENTPPLFLAYDTTALRALLAAWNGTQPQDATEHALRDRALSRLLIASEGMASLFAAVEPLAQDGGKQTVDTITSVLSMRQAVKEASDVLAGVVNEAAPELGETLGRIVLQAVVKALDLVASALQSALTDGVKATLPPFASELFEDAFGVVAKGVLGTFSSGQWNVKDGRKALLEGVVETLLQEVGGRVLGSAYVAQTQQDLTLAEIRARTRNFAGTQVAAFTASTTRLNEAEVRIDNALALTALVGETGKGWSTVADASVLLGRAPGAQIASVLGGVVKSMAVAQLAGATITDYLVLGIAAFEDAPAVAELAFFPTSTQLKGWHPPQRLWLAYGKTLPTDYTNALAALRAALMNDDAEAVQLAADDLLTAEDGLREGLERRQQRLLALTAVATAGLDEAARRHALGHNGVFDVERALLYMQVAGYFLPALADPDTTPADIVAQLDVVSAAGQQADAALDLVESSVEGVVPPAFLLVERHGLGETFDQAAIPPGSFALHVRLRNVGGEDIAAAQLTLVPSLAEGSVLGLEFPDPLQRNLGAIAAGESVDVLFAGSATLPLLPRRGEPVSYRLDPAFAGGQALRANGVFAVTRVTPDDVFWSGFEADD